jgi:hypothetical protein
MVLALKTKVHVSRLERGKKPIIEEVQKELNALGEEEWELVGVQNVRLETGRLFTISYLKRQKA